MGTEEKTSLMSSQNVDHGLSVFTASMFLAGGMAGTGILALPYAVAGTGTYIKTNKNLVFLTKSVLDFYCNNRFDF